MKGVTVKRFKKAKKNGYAKKATTEVVKRAVRQTHELKNLDVIDNAYTAPGVAGGILELLNCVVEGTSGHTRTGRKIFAEYLDINITVISDGVVSNFPTSGTATSGGAQDDELRVMVIMDKECRGAALTPTQVLNDTTTGFLVSANYNFDNVGHGRSDRFKILYDQVHVIHYFNPYSKGALHIKRRVPIQRMVNFFSDTNAGTIADIDSGAIYIYYISSQGNVQYTGNYQFVFRDV